MRKLRYNELDELDWELKHGCYDGPCGDECWDEVCEEMLEEEEVCNFEEGIMGSDITNSHECDEFKLAPIVSSGKLAGYGDTPDIVQLVCTMLDPTKKYHFEFNYFLAS